MATVGPSPAAPDAVERILRALPAWFGIEEALQGYVEAARTLPTYAATIEAEVVGVCLIRRRFPSTAEMDLLAVAPTHQRRGLGRRLVGAAEADLAAQGVRILQVKTLGASHPSPEYAATRRFYDAMGYLPLEEFAADTLWPGNPCLLMAKPLTT